MKVKAAPGLRVPKLGEPRQYIDERRFVEVPENPYYRRLIITGDLILEIGQATATVSVEPEPAAKPKTVKPAKKGDQ